MLETFSTLLSFALITSFTPGPNNISSSIMGINYGYKKTLPYLLGIVLGVLLLLILSSLFSTLLLTFLGSFKSYLGILGAIYILYLSVQTLKANYELKTENKILFDFKKGIYLQFFNPKAILYCLAIYSTILKDMPKEPVYFLATYILLTTICFLAISTWTLAGSILNQHLNKKPVKRVVNLTLALLLALTALQVADLQAFF
ncbi:MAG: cysteine/O-acetylserine efflux protein [Desulfonauticus sp.]|jgi:cysteine/O-acetylserine efflux protein|nr:cysteine/O-acetylserine efflux protein [Desulfonauticus sp.]